MFMHRAVTVDFHSLTSLRFLSVNRGKACLYKVRGQQQYVQPQRWLCIKCLSKCQLTVFSMTANLDVVSDGGLIVSQYHIPV